MTTVEIWTPTSWLTCSEDPAYVYQSRLTMSELLALHDADWPA